MHFHAHRMLQTRNAPLFEQPCESDESTIPSRRCLSRRLTPANRSTLLREPDPVPKTLALSSPASEQRASGLTYSCQASYETQPLHGGAITVVQQAKDAIGLSREPTFHLPVKRHLLAHSTRWRSNGNMTMHGRPQRATSRETNNSIPRINCGEA